MSFPNPFIDPARRLRGGWWIVAYFLLIGATAIPVKFVLHRYAIKLNDVQNVWLMAATAALAAWPCQRLRRQRYANLGFDIGGRWFREFGLGALIGSTLMLAPALVLMAVGAVSLHVATGGMSALWSGALLCMGVAIGEELLFHGFVFQRLIDSTGRMAAQLVMAILFALAHWNNPGMEGAAKIWAGANIFLASLLLGTAYLRTGSLAMPIGLHAAANWMEGNVLGFDVSGTRSEGFFSVQYLGAPEWVTGGKFGLEASAVGLVSIAVTLLLLWAWKPHGTASTDEMRDLPASQPPVRSLP